MSKGNRRKDNLARIVWEWADKRSLEHIPFSGIHYRFSDGGYVTMDVWPSTGSYYIRQTDYVGMGVGAIEREGEKGKLPFGKEIEPFLDKIFYPEVDYKIIPVLK